MNARVRNPELHAKIKSMFMPEKACCLIIEVVAEAPLELIVKRVYTITDITRITIPLGDEKKVFFIVDTLTDNEALFAYQDRFVTLERTYYTNKTIYFSTECEIDMDKVKDDLKQLAKMLRSQAS